MTTNIIRKHIAWMPQQDFDAMRKRDEEVGMILGWSQLNDRWLPPDVTAGECKDDSGLFRDESNELADEHETDAGLPFFSYSMNGAARVLTWIAAANPLMRKLFYANLQKRAAWGNVPGVAAWPDFLTALIPELPRHICEALITTHNQLLEGDIHERQRDIAAFTKSLAEATGQPANAPIESDPIRSPWLRALPDETGTVGHSGETAKRIVDPMSDLAHKFVTKEWFGICPLEDGNLAIKIDETEYNLDPISSVFLKKTLQCMLNVWQEQANKSRSINI